MKTVVNLIPCLNKAKGNKKHW